MMEISSNHTYDETDLDTPGKSSSGEDKLYLFSSV